MLNEVYFFDRVEIVRFPTHQSILLLFMYIEQFSQGRSSTEQMIEISLTFANNNINIFYAPCSTPEVHL
jgi:hypothetical protein